MPEFTIIDGDNDPMHWERQVAQKNLEKFVVTLLRSLANGDSSYQVIDNFFVFLRHAQKTEVPLGPIFDVAIRNLHARAFEKDYEEFRNEQNEVVQAALRVLAEMMATDNAARARLSKREGHLRTSIEQKIIASEERSRANGWSYVQNLTKHLPKITSQKR